jgi:hypothetical protein
LVICWATNFCPPSPPTSPRCSTIRNQAIYDELKFDPESMIQRHNFIISSTALTCAQYGVKSVQRGDEDRSGLDVGGK